MTEPRSATIEAAQIITPRFITKLVELSPTFSARVAIEENLRADIVSAIERARREERKLCIEECAIVALHACFDPPDGGSPTQDEFLVCEEAAKRIRALTPPSQPCEHHYIGGNDGLWCTKCGDEQALTPPSQAPPPITETFAEEVARLNREIGARQSRLQFLICGVPITPPSPGGEG